MKRSSISVADASDEPIRKIQKIIPHSDEISKTHRIEKYLLSLPEPTSSEINVPSIENDAFCQPQTISSEVSSIISNGILDNPIASDLYARIFKAASDHGDHFINQFSGTNDFQQFVRQICYLKYGSTDGRQTSSNSSSNDVANSNRQKKRKIKVENMDAVPTGVIRSRRKIMAVTPIMTIAKSSSDIQVITSI